MSNERNPHVQITLRPYETCTSCNGLVAWLSGYFNQWHQQHKKNLPEWLEKQLPPKMWHPWVIDIQIEFAQGRWVAGWAIKGAMMNVFFYRPGRKLNGRVARRRNPLGFSLDMSEYANSAEERPPEQINSPVPEWHPVAWLIHLLSDNVTITAAQNYQDNRMEQNRGSYEHFEGENNLITSQNMKTLMKQ